MESMTDWAFSWPISAGNLVVSVLWCNSRRELEGGQCVTHVGSSL